MNLRRLFISPLIIICFLIASCTHTPNVSVTKVSSIDDIPDINKVYKTQLTQLHMGMSSGQVLSLFPNVEQECYPDSNVCHFTVFDEQLLQLDQRLSDVNLLAGSLVSLLTITCIIREESCPKAVIAALNLGIATAIENRRLTTSTQNNGTLSLIQWINIEFIDGKVTQWAINEPLVQYRPKSYSNELPPLEESLNLGPQGKNKQLNKNSIKMNFYCLHLFLFLE